MGETGLSVERLRDEDMTCARCGARSREGYVPPGSGCPETSPDLGYSGPVLDHDWRHTSGQDGDADG